MAAKKTKKRSSSPTISVRNAGTVEDLWLQSDGTWGDYKTRAKYSTDDKASAAVKRYFGSDFEHYGTFANSVKKNPAGTKAAYLALFPNLAAAVEFENQVLSIGRAILPPSAIAVLNGKPPTPAYWGFLIDQWNKMNDFGQSLAKHVRSKRSLMR